CARRGYRGYSYMNYYDYW
nr:immunoglobulin heavy chain junction region [Macaca mulatta]MOX92194.1 immunoglobulin heavy chain junction region [Macaca mulatta]MOX92365.1 immunoglobulin heavy chain junction region [Macaca mulatta]MOX92701.1 immunoglobulin heavy chain junction region [Macaca mulatta]MOX94074.1 immunoglobulin heavy chain junction region [Macaca mulatta]